MQAKNAKDYSFNFSVQNIFVIFCVISVFCG